MVGLIIETRAFRGIFPSGKSPALLRKRVTDLSALCCIRARFFFVAQERLTADGAGTAAGMNFRLYSSTFRTASSSRASESFPPRTPSAMYRFASLTPPEMMMMSTPAAMHLTRAPSIPYASRIGFIWMSSEMTRPL